MLNRKKISKLSLTFANFLNIQSPWFYPSSQIFFYKTTKKSIFAVKLRRKSKVQNLNFKFEYKLVKTTFWSADMWVCLYLNFNFWFKNHAISQQKCFHGIIVLSKLNLIFYFTFSTLSSYFGRWSTEIKSSNCKKIDKMNYLRCSKLSIRLILKLQRIWTHYDNISKYFYSIKLILLKRVQFLMEKTMKKVKNALFIAR